MAGVISYRPRITLAEPRRLIEKRVVFDLVGHQRMLEERARIAHRFGVVVADSNVVIGERARLKQAV